MKKCLKTITVLLLISLLSACSTLIAENGEDHANETLVGQISTIDGTTITLDLGKVKEVQNNEGMPEMNGQPPFNNGEMPEDFDPSQLPERPEDLDPSELPEKPEDFDPSQMNGSPMENGQQPPQGEEDFDPSQMDGNAPQFTEGERPDMKQDGFSGQPMGNRTVSYTFTVKKGTATIDIAAAEVTLSDGTTGTISDLKTGDVVEAVVNENNQVTSIKVYNIVESSEE